MGAWRPTLTTAVSRRQALIYAIGLLLILVAWHQVFVMTGVLWWNAPSGSQTVSAPAALPDAQPDTSWVDPQAYLRTHPEWNPR